MAIALGYEDLNDHDELRQDPVLAMLAGIGDHCREIGLGLGLEWQELQIA